MFENIRLKFAIVEIGIIHHDHMAIRADVLASNLDRTLVVAQSWWPILYGLTAEKSTDLIDGVVVDYASIESIAFDQRCWRFEWVDVVVVRCEYGRGFDEHHGYRRCCGNFFDSSSESQANISQAFAVFQSVSFSI